MATLVFAAAGSAIGGAVGGTFLGVSAAVIGQAVGASVGSVIDQALAPGLGTTKREGPRLDNLQVTTSEEGAALPDIYGRTAIAGQIIWAAKLRETKSTDTERVGSGKRKSKVKTTEYSYSASFALSLGEAANGFGRIWADNIPLDVSDMLAEGRLRFYPGSNTQTPDPLIVATEGEAPAFRGTAYLVFEDLPLATYGNRIPQFRVEVFGRSGDMENQVRGVCLIPGSTEWGYDPEPAKSVAYSGQGEIISEQPMNSARFAGVSDWSLSLDHMDKVLPQADTVSLVVAWFGTDLRAGRCEIEPRVEFSDRDTEPRWRAAGLTYYSDEYAQGVSYPKVGEVSRTADGAPAYGSTPADGSVIRAIQDLKARGKRVVLYPFVMMDVPGDANLPDPLGNGTQGAYPWRGRIAPEAGNPVADEIAAFMGTATAADFTAGNGDVDYSGPNEWRFRRFILHLAALAKAAGGVDAFLIGSEMRGLSFASDTAGVYPFVDGLRDLAGEVRTLLPDALLSYAADWSEYHSHRTGAEVWFHLDSLWADPAIDFIGIDNYLPLSDWRPGTDHLDYDPNGPTSVYDLDYLKGNIEGGEYWDFYYASDADRAAQIRSPITPGPDAWIYRQKAIRDWHANAHHNRPGGTPEETPTAWGPGSKPVWFTEIGCPAATYGTNQPNVFAAQLSSESALPYFSDGVRDDFIQRQYLRAMFEWWGENGGGVVNPANIQVWCWDARPFPEFPRGDSLWSDGGDWRLGHWLNGRAGAAPVAEIVKARADRHGLALSDLDLSRAWGQADGYAVPGPTGLRDALQPLEVGLGATVVEIDGGLVVESKAAPRVVSGLAEADLVDRGDPSVWTLTRGAIEDVAQSAVLRFRDGLNNYQSAAARAVIGAGREDGVAQAESPLVLDFERGQAAAERLLRSASAGRESLVLRVPRSVRDLRPGVLVPVDLGGMVRPFIVERIVEGTDRLVEARSYDAAAFGAIGGAGRPAGRLPVLGSGAVVLVPMDLPILRGRPEVAEWDGWFAAHASPWPGGVGLIQATEETGTGDSLEITGAATVGELTADLAPGRAWTWTKGPLEVRLYRGGLVARSKSAVLDGANALAVQHADGWEVLQFAGAELIGGNTWRLTDLIRGQRGTESFAQGTAPTGARVILLDGAVTSAELAQAERGRSFWWRYGPSDDDPITFAAKSHAFTGAGLKPFAPVHLKADASGGDLVFSWVRRSRLAVANNGTEPPLGEAFERYRVEIGPEGSPARSVTVSAPSFTWSAAMQDTDALSGPVAVRVAQLSETYGPGSWAEIEVEQ